MEYIINPEGNGSGNAGGGCPSECLTQANCPNQIIILYGLPLCAPKYIN